MKNVQIFDVTSSGSRQNGLTLVELMVSLALAGIVITGVFRVLLDFQNARWAQESKSLATVEIDQITNAIRSTIPNYIMDVTGVDGEQAPDGKTWKCNSGRDCSMTLLKGGRVPRDTKVMEVNCVATTEAHLTGIELIDSATKTSLSGAGIWSRCAQCPIGKTPVVTTYNVNRETLASGNYTARTYPSKIAASTGGLVGLDVCVTMDPYDFNKGTSGVTNIVKRYDRWTVTIVPIYMRGKMPVNPDSSFKPASYLMAKPDKILLAPFKQLGSEFQYERLQ